MLHCLPISWSLIDHLVICGDKCNLCSMLRSSVHPPVTSSLLSPNTFLSTMSTNTFNMSSFLTVTNQVSDPKLNVQAGGKRKETDKALEGFALITACHSLYSILTLFPRPCRLQLRATALYNRREHPASHGCTVNDKLPPGKWYTKLQNVWRNACSILLGKLEGKKLLGRFRQKWKDNIKMYFKEIGWKGIGWINLAQGRDKWQDLVIMVTNHSSLTKCREFLD